MIKQFRTISYRSFDASGSPVPSLPIQGAFLRRYGFDVSDTVEVRYSPGFVSIRSILNDRFGPDSFGIPVRQSIH